jgi:hypothetical protein
MWVRFKERFSWHVTPAVTIVFKPDGGPFKDGRYQVTRACAAAAGDVAERRGKQENSDGNETRFGIASEQAELSASRDD